MIRRLCFNCDAPFEVCKDETHERRGFRVWSCRIGVFARVLGDAVIVLSDGDRVLADDEEEILTRRVLPSTTEEGAEFAGSRGQRLVRADLPGGRRHVHKVLFDGAGRVFECDDCGPLPLVAVPGPTPKLPKRGFDLPLKARAIMTAKRNATRAAKAARIQSEV